MEEYLLLLLDSAKGSIEGETKFQKIVFLGQEEFQIPFNFSYKWDNHGPFSGDLRDSLKNLQDKGLIDIREENKISPLNDSYKVRIFSLTNDGRKIVRNIILKIHGEITTKIHDLIETYGYLPLKDILKYVYRTYTPKDLES